MDNLIESFPFNLMKDLLGEDYAFRVDTVELIKSIESLSENEYYVVNKRYREKTAIEKIGESMGIYNEEVEQIQSMALRKLRHLSRSRRIIKVERSDYEEVTSKMYSLEEEKKDVLTVYNKIINDYKSMHKKFVETITILENKTRAQADIYKLILNNFQESDDSLNVVIEILKSEDKEAISSIIELINKKNKINNVTPMGTPSEISIDELEFSVRTHNCLKRHGTNTVEDLTKLSEGDLSKVKHLGKKGVEEIKDKLVEIGYKLAESVQELE